MTATRQCSPIENGPQTTEATASLNQTAQLAMLERLQTTLDLTQLVTLIHEQVNHHVRVDGVEFLHEEQGLRILSGRKSTHSCGYRLVTGNNAVGELVFRRNHKFPEKELALVETLMPLFIAPLRNALQFRAAIDRSFRDQLSGARNQRSLWQILPREIALSRRHNRPLSGLLIDVEELGTINRRFGRSAGDRILRTVVDVIGTLCRATDLLFRVEDDTLLLLLQETGEDGAELLAQRLVSASLVRRIDIDGHCLQPAVRVASVTASGTDSAASFIARGLQRSAATFSGALG